MGKNTPGRLIARQLLEAWQYRGLNHRKSSPRSRVHPRQIARARAHAEDVVLYQGRPACRSCLRDWTPGHVCPFPEDD